MYQNRLRILTEGPENKNKKTFFKTKTKKKKEVLSTKIKVK
jgi:hypothetical protein